MHVNQLSHCTIPCSVHTTMHFGTPSQCAQAYRCCDAPHGGRTTSLFPCYLHAGELCFLLPSLFSHTLTSLPSQINTEPDPWTPLQPFNNIATVLPPTPIAKNTAQQTESPHTQTQTVRALKPQHTTNYYLSKLSLDHLDQVGTQTEINNLIQLARTTEETTPQDITVKNTIGKKCRLMYPTGYALNHKAALLLLGYAKHGCLVDCGADWSKDCIIDAITGGAHQSAYDPKAVTFLQEETNEKIQNGYTQVVTWKNFKDDIPPSLKISPVAMVPHKSKLF